MCGDAAELLETVEQPLDVVAGAVAPVIACGWIMAVGFGRDDRQDVVQQQPLTDSIAVVSLIGQQRLAQLHRHIKQLGNGAIVGDLAAGQDEAERRP